MVISLHIPVWADDFISVHSKARIIQYAFRIVAEGVPFFVTMNGFLMLQKSVFDLKKHINKCIKLVELLFVWAFIIIICSTFILGTIGELTIKEFLKYTFETGINATYTGVLWFLQNLLAVYFIFPILWKIYHDDTKLFCYFFVIITIFIPGISLLGLIRDSMICFAGNYDLDMVIKFLNRFNPIGNGWFVYYFCLGGLIGKYTETIRKRRNEFIILGFISWLVAFVYGYYMSMKQGILYNHAFNYSSIFMVLFIIGIFALTLNFDAKKNIFTKISSKIGRNTFGMYVVHVIIIRLITKYYNIQNLRSRLAVYIIVVVVSYFFTELLSKNKYLRKIVMTS